MKEFPLLVLYETGRLSRAADALVLIIHHILACVRAYNLV